MALIWYQNVCSEFSHQILITNVNAILIRHYVRGSNTLCIYNYIWSPDFCLLLLRVARHLDLGGYSVVVGFVHVRLVATA